jgi:hypothetical protein
VNDVQKDKGERPKVKAERERRYYRSGSDLTAFPESYGI